MFGAFSRYGTIKNIKIKNSYIKGLSGVGGIVGIGPRAEACGDIDNCSIEGVVIGERSVGGIICGDAGNVTNCINYANIYGGITSSYSDNNSGMGGIVGGGALSIEYCKNEGDIKAHTNYVGGIIGLNAFEINDVYNYGNVSGLDYVGGITGKNKGVFEGEVMSASINFGEVNGSNNVGGIIGNVNSAKVLNSYNFGNINGSSNVGGITGFLDSYYEDVFLKKCYNIGNIIGNDKNIGGLVGKRELHVENISLENTLVNCYYLKDSTVNINTNLNGIGNEEDKVNQVEARLKEFFPVYSNPDADVSFEKLGYPKYTVTFKDYDGKILKTQEVEFMSSVLAPSNPSREGYTFIGWDKTFDKITSDLVVTAKYKENAKPSTPVSPTKPSETPEKPNTSDKNNSSNNNQNTTVNKSLPNIDITPYMFNYIYYADMNEDLKKAFGYNEEALKNHYLTFGIKEGRKASPIFDARYYLNKYSDLKKVFGNNYEGAYYHFINSGISEGRQASKYFDVKYYGKKYADLKKAYGENYKYMAMHFMTSGINEGRQGSNDFNVNEYYKKSSEFEKNNIKQNYIKYYALASGAKVIENNSINITAYMFDADLYYSLYPDLQKNIGYNVDGLKAHYLSFGIKEGRIASYVFNPVYYLNTYKDLSNAFGKKGYESAYYHFINSGINEGRTASKLFNAREYLKTYKDLVNIFDKNYSKALEHFVACGMKEGRTGSSLFSSYVYKKNNNDLSKVFGNNLKEYFKHYIMFGQYEKRKCF